MIQFEKRWNVICSFFPFSSVLTTGFEPRTLSANDKHAKPLDHTAALCRDKCLSLFLKQPSPQLVDNWTCDIILFPMYGELTDQTYNSNNPGIQFMGTFKSSMTINAYIDKSRCEFNQVINPLCLIFVLCAYRFCINLLQFSTMNLHLALNLLHFLLDLGVLKA
jgi:hypothetical protein